MISDFFKGFLAEAVKPSLEKNVKTGSKINRILRNLELQSPCTKGAFIYDVRFLGR